MFRFRSLDFKKSICVFSALLATVVGFAIGPAGARPLPEDNNEAAKPYCDPFEDNELVVCPLIASDKKVAKVVYVWDHTGKNWPIRQAVQNWQQGTELDVKYGKCQPTLPCVEVFEGYWNDQADRADFHKTINDNGANELIKTKKEGVYKLHSNPRSLSPYAIDKLSGLTVAKWTQVTGDKNGGKFLRSNAYVYLNNYQVNQFGVDMPIKNARAHFACHELGHALGVSHQHRKSSCVSNDFYRDMSTTPDVGDKALLNLGYRVPVK